MDTSFLSLAENINLVRYNPSAMNRLIYRNLSDLTEGRRQVCDATNPLAFGIDASCAVVSAFMTQNQVVNRRQYAAAAQTWDDLYYHMSDKDYINRFATPSRTTMSLLLSVNEILENAKPTSNPNIRKLVIPRNTYFTVAGIKFSMSYPVELRVVSHGGLNILYDVSQPSPLATVNSNQVPMRFVSNSGIEWIKLDIDVQQFDIKSVKGSLNKATGFRSVINLDDHYYYCRVYVENDTGGWQEIRTTHAQNLYDATQPTAVLRVVEKQLTVEIPQIYTSTILRGRAVRIDAYQTKGPMSMILDNYAFNRFSATFSALDAAEDNEFVAPLRSLHNVAVFSQGIVSGGTLGLSFDAMRTRVMKNATQMTVPITNVQIEATVIDAGYDIVKNVDFITNRVFLATRALPAPEVPEQATTDNKNVVTGAAMSMETLSASFASLAALDSVINNGERLTITPDTLYQVTGGLVRAMSNDEVARLVGLPVDSRAVAVTNGQYLFTPFHYVLDTTDGEFSSRAYYLDAPKVLAKSYLAENETTLLQVSVDSYEFVRSPNGYKLTVITKSNAGWQAIPDDQVHVEIAFIPPGEKDYAHLLGELVGYSGSERVFEFNFDTRFDVNRNDQLVLNSFLLYSEETHATPTDLTGDFMLFWSCSAVMPEGWKRVAMDDLLGTFELPSRIAAVAQESITIEFGDALKRLWSRARSVISSVPYKLWTMDIPWTYEEDVYKTDAEGNIGEIIDGEYVYELLHSKGDVVMVEDGEGGLTPSIRYYAGTPQLDAGGKPIPAETTGMTRQIDLLLLEGAYWFATEAVSTEYVKTITKLLVGWLTEDLEAVQTTLLEQTRLYFYPKSAMGGIDVMILDGLVTTMEAGQSFTIQFSVSSTVAKDLKLQAKIERRAIQLIADKLKESKVAHSEIVDTLQDEFGNDIKGLTLSMFGEGKNVDVLTVMDDATRMGIRKRVAALADGTLAVQDDVTFIWLTHEKRD
jgi:hypothetical protein